MSKYYDAIHRNLATTREPLPPVRPRAKLVSKTRDLIEQPAREVAARTDAIAFENPLLPEPLSHDLPAMLARQFPRIVTLEEDGTAETDGLAGGCQQGSCQDCGKVPPREGNHVKILSIGLVE